MKTIKYILVLLLFWANTSCADFLDRYPQDSVTNETYWKTEEQLRAALYPCYEAFEYELMIKWAESTAETVMWGDKNSGLSKVPEGNMLIRMVFHLLPIGGILMVIFIHVIISWIIMIKQRLNRM
nr:hypothetical protein [Bacteroides nordii]